MFLSCAFVNSYYRVPYTGRRSRFAKIKGGAFALGEVHAAFAAEQKVSVPTPWHRHLYARVLLAIVAGVAVGYAFPKLGASLKPLGDAFVSLVKMIIAPVIFLTVSTGIGGMADTGKVGSVFGKALAYFLAVSTLALVIGLVVGNVVHPGSGLHINPASLDSSSVVKYASAANDQTIVGFLLHIIPKTLISALVDGEILQVLLVAILTGLAIGMAGAKSAPLMSVLSSATNVVFKIVHLLMVLAPFGAFGAMAYVIAVFGLGTLANLAALVATFYLTSTLFVLVVLGAIARVAGFSILKMLAYLKDELLLTLGTSSSEAALPALMEKMECAGCRKDVVGLVIPTGYSFNLAGTNIYMTLAATFIAQALGIHLSTGDQIMLLSVAMISSKGAAGVTGAGFIILAATLSVVPSLPVAGMALILGVDRFLSECRALTNLIGNAVATVVVAHWENALDEDALAAALNHAAPARKSAQALR